MSTDCHSKQIENLRIVVEHLTKKISDMRAETPVEFRSSVKNGLIAKYNAELNMCRKALDILLHESDVQTTKKEIVDDIDVGVM